MDLSQRILRAVWAGAILGAAARTPAVEAGAASAPSAVHATDRLDDEAFRRGLRERGLIELLELFDREHPATDEISRALRQRETLLRACDDAQRSLTDRADACRRALDILEKLVAENPNHPDRFAWRLEMGRDLVERQSASALEALLFRVASPKQRDEIAATADRAIAVLQRLADDLAAEWRRLSTLPPEQFEQLAAANRPKQLESIEAAKSTKPQDIVTSLEKWKNAEGDFPFYFREWDHQLVRPAVIVKVKAPRPMVAGIRRRGISAAWNIRCAIGTSTKNATKTLTPP